MIIPKPKLVVRFLLGALLMTFVITACNNNTAEKKEEAPAATPTDTSSAAKMDTATTRPVKTTN